MLSWDTDIYAEFFYAYFQEVQQIANSLDFGKLYNIVNILADTRAKGGRVFVLGIGGSAANASHFVNDLRKLCNMQAYSPVDNVSELTARANDEGMSEIFCAWLETSKLNNKDCLFILSVGGGTIDPLVSPGIIRAIDYAHKPEINAMVLGICGKSDGHLATSGDYVVVVPCINSTRLTPHTEEFQSVICHFLVSHPDLKENRTKW